MKCIVPLAGGDLVHPKHEFRPWFPVGDQCLLQVAVNQRAWRQKLADSDYIFVVREVPGLERLVNWLLESWPGCGIVRLSNMTAGAMFTAMAGLSLVKNDNEIIIVDLADILFTTGPSDPERAFSEGVGAIIPCFESSEPCYSYLRKEGSRVVEAAEKRVISNTASAGVYMFKNRSTYLIAAQHSIANAAELTVRGVFFVCPMANGVIAAGQKILAPMVDNVRAVGKIFH